VIVVTVPFRDYIRGTCILALVLELLFLPAPLLPRIAIAGLIVFIMLLLTGKIFQWTIRALTFVSVFLYALITGLIRAKFQRKGV
jgi:hypothetical protein